MITNIKKILCSTTVKNVNTMASMFHDSRINVTSPCRRKRPKRGGNREHNSVLLKDLLITKIKTTRSPTIPEEKQRENWIRKKKEEKVGPLWRGKCRRRRRKSRGSSSSSWGGRWSGEGRLRSVGAPSSDGEGQAVAVAVAATDEALGYCRPSETCVRDKPLLRRIPNNRSSGVRKSDHFVGYGPYGSRSIPDTILGLLVSGYRVLLIPCNLTGHTA